MLSCYLYRSTACVPPRSTQEALVYLQSQRRNAAWGISGFLHREDGCFLQYIEGPADKIACLRRIIHADWRHRNIEVLVRAEVANRRFSGWDMALGESESALFHAFQSRRGRSLGMDLASVRDICAFLDHLSQCKDAPLAAPAAEPTRATRVSEQSSVFPGRACSSSVQSVS